MWIALVLVAAIVAVICWLRFKPKPQTNSTDDVSVIALRNAVTTAGGSPASYEDVTLLRQLITAWGGTPSYYDIIDLLRQAITVAGGTPTQTSQTMLLRELITQLGGTPASYNADALFEQLGPIASIGLHTLSLSKATFLNGVADSGTINGATSGSTVAATGLPTGLTINGPARTWAWDGLQAITPGTFTLTETKAGVTGSPKANTITTYGSAASFTLNDLSSVAASSVQTSNLITISGIGPGDSIPVTLTGDASRVLLKNGSVVSNTTTGVNGDQFAVRLTASGTDGTTISGTLTIGTTADTYSITTLSSTISAFTLAFPAGYVAGSAITALDISGLNLTPGVGQVQAGDFIELEYVNSTTPTLNGDNTYSTSGQTVVPYEHTFTESEQATAEDGAGNLQIDLTGIGWQSPSGAGRLHGYIKRTDGITTILSPMSNQLSYNISSSVAQWVTANGSNKSSIITVSGGANLTIKQNTTNTGGWAGIRTTIAGAAKCWVEATIDAQATDAVGNFALGFCDATATPGVNRPGISDSHGIIVVVAVGSNFANVFVNGGSNPASWTLPSNLAAVDILALEKDNSTSAGAHVLRLIHRRGSTDTVVGTLSTLTMTGMDYFFEQEVSNVQATTNFGGTSRQSAAGSGFTSGMIYG